MPTPAFETAGVTSTEPLAPTRRSPSQTIAQRVAERRAVGSDGAGEEVQKRRAVFGAARAGERVENVRGVVRIVKRLGILLGRNTERQIVAERDINDQRLDQHLRQRHVNLGDDILDHLHVLPRGIDQQRAGTRVRNNFRLAEQLNLVPAAAAAAAAAGLARTADNVVQPLRESGSARGRAVGICAARAQAAAVAKCAARAAEAA